MLNKNMFESTICYNLYEQLINTQYIHQSKIDRIIKQWF